MQPTKKDLLKAIRDYCKKCFPKSVNCQDNECLLHPYRHEDAMIQTDIFRCSDKDLFFSRVIQCAKEFGHKPFYWSELRKNVDLRPLHNNWWGISTRILKKQGFHIIEGTRRSAFKSRCGAPDRQWKRF